VNGDLHRRFPVAVNAEAMALAWTRQEAAGAGAVVVVDHEISPRGRLGRLWPHPQERTAVLAMVWRPALPAEAADVIWLAASLGLLSGAVAVDANDELALWWPDAVVDPAGERVGEVKAEVQLGPGRVTSAVVTGRLDIAALGAIDREVALPAIASGLHAAALQLDEDPDGVRSTYAERSFLTGRRVVAHLLPRGEARGTVRSLDARGRLELVSSTGLVENVPIVGLDRITVSPRVV